MRILHTADWHLGRMFQGMRLLDDQAHVLNQFIQIVADTKPDCVVIAGDVYDRAVPPPEAVALFDETLSQIVLKHRVPTLVIAGNHDSPERLEFGGRIFDAASLHVSGRCRNPPKVVTLRDAHGPVHFALLPFAEPGLIKQLLLKEENDEKRFPQPFHHGAALAEMVRVARTQIPSGERSVAIAHGAILSGMESESERPLWVEKAGYAEPTLFADFSYTALGHFHQPQGLTDRVAYSGSLLPYSFSEEGQQKSAALIDIDAAGKVASRELLPLIPRHPLRTLEGKFSALSLESNSDSSTAQDYLRIRLLDEEPVLDAMARLREIYPNILYIEQPNLFSPKAGDDLASTAETQFSPMELFDTFFERMTGEKMNEEERAVLLRVWEKSSQQKREAA